MREFRSVLFATACFAAFVSLEVGWHWYLSTRMPGAAGMHIFYAWQALESMRIRHDPPVPALIDVFFPVAALGIAGGLASSRVHWGFALAYAIAFSVGIVGLLPLYGHLVPPGYWHLHWGWGPVLGGCLFVLLPVTGGALTVRAGIRERRGRSAARNGGVGAAGAEVGAK